MLDDRLDLRLSEVADPTSLANRWKQTKRTREAAAFDDVADQIEAGLLKIRGTEADGVVGRLRTRAENTRRGTDRHRRKALKKP